MINKTYKMSFYHVDVWYSLVIMILFVLGDYINVKRNKVKRK